jgi:hypothetical protein
MWPITITIQGTTTHVTTTLAVWAAARAGLGGDDSELPAERVWIFMLATLLFVVLQVAAERMVPDRTFKTMVQEQRQECKKRANQPTNQRKNARTHAPHSA